MRSLAGEGGELQLTRLCRAHEADRARFGVQTGHPFDDPTAPSSPFAMTQYRLEATAEAKELETAADALAAQARENVQRATNYVLAVVLPAVVLFFAGISTKLADPRLRRRILGAAVVVLVATVVWLVTSPVSISV